MGVVATKLQIAARRYASEVASMRLLKRVAQPISERPLRFSISTICQISLCKLR